MQPLVVLILQKVHALAAGGSLSNYFLIYGGYPRGTTSEGRSTSARRIASLRPLFTAPAAPYFHLRRGLLFSCPSGARLVPNRRRGGSIDGFYAITSPPSSTMDRAS